MQCHLHLYCMAGTVLVILKPLLCRHPSLTFSAENAIFAVLVNDIRTVLLTELSKDNDC